MLKWVESHLGHYKYQNTDEKWTLVDQGQGKNGLTLSIISFFQVSPRIPLDKTPVLSSSVETDTQIVK